MTERADLQVTVAADGRLAVLRVAPGTNAALGELRAALAAAGVTTGIDEDALTRLADHLEEPATAAAIEIAHAIAPEDGVDGAVESRVDALLQAGRTGQHGAIDYRERNALQTVIAGDVVAVVRPPTTGTPGRTVAGKEIPARPGRAREPKLGPGLGRRGNELVAQRDGILLFTDEFIDVTPLHVHKGDVDYATGNLHANGTLIITGDVTAGFLAEASGDVVVHGSVESAIVRAGDMADVQHGILGEGSVVQAGTDLACRHVTAARLVAGREVRITDQCHQSRITADTIRIDRGHGVVRGGELRAQQKIVVGTAGCPSGTETRLVVGEPQAQRVAAARETVQAARAARALKKATGRSGKPLRAAVRAADREREARLQVRREREQLLRNAEIKITATCHVGVVLCFGGTELRPDVALEPSVFHFDQEQRTIVRRLLP